MKHQSLNSDMSSFKFVLISTSVLSAAIVLKLSAPAITDFAESLPSIYRGFVSWLRPPYLYLVINFIILTIAASANLQSVKDDGASQSLDHPRVVMMPESPADYKFNGVVSNGYEAEKEQCPELDSLDRADAKDKQSPLVVTGVEDAAVVEMDATSNKENEFLIAAKSTWMLSDNRDSAENSPWSVKPPVTARLAKRRNVKSSPEGVAKIVLGVSRPKAKRQQDTLESTWRTITQGGTTTTTPMTRHLKKSNTLERGHKNHHHLPEKTPPRKVMKKAETFNTGRSPSPGGSSKLLRQEVSLRRDELHRRVEAFIKKFNEEMRLQRQESLNQYKEMMINHSAT